MKKILSLGLAITMAMAAMPAAYAADYTQGTQVEYIADADANREYTITVPALMNPGQSGTVTLQGKWASDETVKVTADATVELTNSINASDKHTLDITFPGIEKAGDNTVEKTYTETVAVAEMPAAALFGTWSGKFNYNVEFDDNSTFLFDGWYVNADTTEVIKAVSLEENGVIRSYSKNISVGYGEGYTYDGNKAYSASGNLAYTVSNAGRTITLVKTGETYQFEQYPETFNFVIGEKTYQSEWGLTFAEWIDSDYNTDGFAIEDLGSNQIYIKLGNQYLGQGTSRIQLVSINCPHPFMTFSLVSA